MIFDPRVSRKASAVLLAALTALAASAALPLSTATAQEIGLPGLRAGRLTEADLAKGTTIIIVWASNAPRSARDGDIVSRANAIAGRWNAQARVVTVNAREDRKAVEAFLNGKNLRVPVYLDADGAFSNKHAVTNLPGLLVVKNGRTAYHGKLPDDPDAVLAEILR